MRSVTADRIVELRTIPALDGLDNDDVWNLALSSHRRCAELGELVFHPQRAHQSVVMVVKGRVHLYRLSSQGRAIALEYFGPGSICGLPHLGRSVRPTGYVEADCHGTVVYLVPSEILRLTVVHIPGVAARFLDLMALEVSKAQNLIEELAFCDLRQRIAHHLARQAANDAFNIVTTHEALAQAVAAHREDVTKALHQLERAGLIRCDRQHHQIKLLVSPEQLGGLGR